MDSPNFLLRASLHVFQSLFELQISFNVVPSLSVNQFFIAGLTLTSKPNDWN